MSLPTTLLRFILFFCKRHVSSLAGLLLIGVLWAVHFCLSPTLMKIVIDRITQVSPGHLSPVIGPLAVYLALVFMLFGASTWYDYLVMKTFPAIRAHVIAALQQTVLGYPYRLFQRHLSGSLTNKISDLSKGVVTIITSFIDDFFARSLLFILGVITLAAVHYVFSVVLIVWVILFFALSSMFLKGSMEKTARFSEARSTLMGKIVDGLTNIFNIKVFNTSRHEGNYLNTYLQHMQGEEQALHAYLLRLKLTQGISIVVLMVTMVSLLLYTYKQGLTTIGDFALVLALTNGLVDEIFYLALQWVQWVEEIGIARQALEVFREPVVDTSSFPLLKVSQGEIVFDRVSFFYTPHKPIFEHLSLHIDPGSKVGIVGLSGSGKSTFAHLLLRLYEVTSGHIFVDGQDLNRTCPGSVSSQIGVVPQDPYLFHRSIEDNIRYGCQEASHEDVIEAAIKANCHDFITALPHGYATLVGERGSKVSGGQRQLIAIARVFLKNPRIVILDEATSALDVITERKVQNSLNLLMEGRTVILIAHRLSTLSGVQTVFVFEHGKLVERGAPAELIRSQGRYAELWALSQGVKPAVPVV